MTSLVDTHPSTGHVAAQNYGASALAGVAGLFESFSRALAFSRLCEAEFNRKGEIAPETYKRLIAEV